MPVSNAPASSFAESASEPEPPLLERHEDVAALADRIRADGIMGLDTEFISEGYYQPRLALLQVSTRDGIYLIDPLSDRIQQAPDQPIWDAMADPSVRTIVHAYEQEALFCLQRTGRAPGDLFDVQLAAGFNGHHYPIAYEKLVGRELRRSLGPSQSRTNWLQRPLTAAQQRYAADDVRWLLPLHHRFLARLTDDPQQRPYHWLREETARRLEQLSSRDADRWWRLIGRKRLSPRSLAALRELSGWRDSVARQRDVPLRRVASDDLLVAVAASLPRNREELASVRGIDQIRSSSRPALLQAVADARAIPEAELPERASLPRGRNTAKTVMLFLSSVLAASCAEHQIDPELVGGPRQLRALVHWVNQGRPPERTPLLLTGWRGAVCGQPLLDALAGRISLTIADPLGSNPLAVAGPSVAPS